MSSANNLQQIIEEGLCIGCGLCASVFPDNIQMQLSPSGHLRPDETTGLSPAQTEKINSFCPGVVQSGMPSDQLVDKKTIDPTWGAIDSLCKAHASNPLIRFKAATGGALTAISTYLIESGKVDAVLHVAPGGLKPYFGHSALSKTVKQVLAGTSSIYAPTSPLEQLIATLEKKIKIALVAKPCDISAVRLLGKSDERINQYIKVMLAPICGGFFPSFAMNNFLISVGANEDEVKSVSYRGEGCPGPTSIQLLNGESIKRSYLQFWGTDSSQWHIPWRCRICPDGSGEAADIVAGDTWPGCEPTEQMMEQDSGTNVIIARTTNGSDIIEAAIKANHLTFEGKASVSDLDLWQPHLVRKKVKADARYYGMRQAGQRGLSTVDLRTNILKKRMSVNEYRSEFEGTTQRIKIGKHLDTFGTDSME